MARMMTKEGSPLPLGIRKIHNTVYFSVSVAGASQCRLNLYEKGKYELYESILLGESHRIGNIFCIAIENFDYYNLEYLYETSGKEFIDPYAKKITGRKIFGRKLKEEESKLIRGGFSFEEYDWEQDKFLKIPYEEQVLYRLHIRGFTKDVSSKVKNKGTFSGIIEKIPYLKELGINGIELLPAYEFNEMPSKESGKGMLNTRFVNQSVSAIDRINYWGFAEDNFYFAPKDAFAAEDCVTEFKDLVKALHQNGIELMMEFHFSKGTNEQLISDCLRSWVLEFHVDGFHVNQNIVPSKLIATDPLLADTKLFGLSWNIDGIHKESQWKRFRNLAEYNDGFLIEMRKFLKGDEEQISKASFHFKHNSENNGIINYITNTNGFTLMDLFSYDVKHNDENGESNQDGTDYNYSWNCGVEGATKRKKILELRRKQVRNALTTMVFSQGVPLILAGDEFGNSQRGNNNAYCQDNKISWLNWKQLDINKDIFEFLKLILSIRKEHPILHQKKEFKCMDYASCGCPDLSFHGTKSWYPDYTNHCRVLGIMLCGKYAPVERINSDCYFYFAYNMHWLDHEFDLPKLPENEKWSILVNTGLCAEELDNQKKYKVKARSIVVFVGK